MSYQLAELLEMLSSEGTAKTRLFAAAAATKASHVGRITYLRGLIEYSNRCRKNCLYCGIRCGNKQVVRYTLTDQQVLEAAAIAEGQRYGSVVLQGGENTDPQHIRTIESLVHQIKVQSGGTLGITLSLGEQSEETYRRWFEAGAHRYLLRIESSNPELYRRIHPTDSRHTHKQRLAALDALQKTGYQVGTGVMIGLPFQRIEDLAGDLLFFREHDIDMCGMGPYLEHHETPLYTLQDQLQPLAWRFEMGLKMVATLRLLMPDINIAATTALQTIDPLGREKALQVGANIVMPNITPQTVSKAYKLYENKPVPNDDTDERLSLIHDQIALSGDTLGYDTWGDSPHFKKRTKNE